VSVCARVCACVRVCGCGFESDEPRISAMKGRRDKDVEWRMSYQLNREGIDGA
jgi:hypothetical protein